MLYWILCAVEVYTRSEIENSVKKIRCSLPGRADICMTNAASKFSWTLPPTDEFNSVLIFSIQSKRMNHKFRRLISTWCLQSKFIRGLHQSVYDM